MTEKKYAINEIFYTIQGEGSFAGTPAVFVRFAGCNLWRNTPETREADAERSSAFCPTWCDTEFGMREMLTAREIVERVQRAWLGPDRDLAAGREITEAPLRLIVLTGGEPLLQFDADLFEKLYYETDGLVVSIETNGTKELPEDEFIHEKHEEGALFITCSPKVPPAKLQLRHLDELKVVFPDYVPHLYSDHFRAVYEDRAVRERYVDFDEVALFIQPRAVTPSSGTVGKSLISNDHTERAVAFVMKNPQWRLSMQTHKILGVP